MLKESEATHSTPTFRRLGPDALARRADTLADRYADCDLCAHECGVDRTAGETGACAVDDTLHVSDYHPHHGEEAVLSGENGSGTIFLTYCSLSCVFCQNWEIAIAGHGSPVSPDDIADMTLELQKNGCHNINFVTPTHFTPGIVEALAIAREEGLDLPIVWNTGGYERAEVIRELDGVIDIYMPDVKWAEDEPAALYSKAPNYWDTNREALREMHHQVGDLQIDEDSLATQGLLVRHLVMPGYVENAKSILEFLHQEISPDTYVNIMGQYTPYYKAASEDRYYEINRRVSQEEYREVVEYARDLGLSRIETNPV